VLCKQLLRVGLLCLVSQCPTACLKWIPSLTRVHVLDGNPCLGIALERLRSLVLGPQGSHVTLEFKREVMGRKVLYYDVELVRGSPSFLKLLQRCHTLAEDSDRLKNLLSLEQIKTESLQAEKVELQRRVEQGVPSSSLSLRVADLEGQLENAQHEVSLLKHHLHVQEERNARLESTLSMLQTAANAQAEDKHKIELQEKDRLAWLTEVERRRAAEREMNYTVQSKLQGDLSAETAAREKAEDALVQALADSQLIRQEVSILRMREGNVRTRLDAGHRALKHALSLNDAIGMELATLIPDQEHSFHMAVAALKQVQPSASTACSSLAEQACSESTGNVLALIV